MEEDCVERGRRALQPLRSASLCAILLAISCMIGPLPDQPVMGSMFTVALDARFHERYAVTLDVAQRWM